MATAHDTSVAIATPPLNVCDYEFREVSAVIDALCSIIVFGCAPGFYEVLGV